MLMNAAKRVKVLLFPRSDHNLGSHIVNFLLLARLPRAMTMKKMDKLLQHERRTLPQPNNIPPNQKTALRRLGVSDRLLQSIALVRFACHKV